MRKRELMKRIDRALDRIRKEISANASTGVYGAGLSAEGYAGGYRDALHAVISLLNDVPPKDDRHYWDLSKP